VDCGAGVLGNGGNGGGFIYLKKNTKYLLIFKKKS
jgi:hypothetical protein